MEHGRGCESMVPGRAVAELEAAREVEPAALEELRELAAGVASRERAAALARHRVVRVVAIVVALAEF